MPKNAHFCTFLRILLAFYKKQVLPIAILVHLPMVELCLSQFLYISHRARGKWWSKGEVVEQGGVVEQGEVAGHGEVVEQGEVAGQGSKGRAEAATFLLAQGLLL